MTSRLAEAGLALLDEGREPFPGIGRPHVLDATATENGLYVCYALTPIHCILLERRALDLDYYAFSKQGESTPFVDPSHLASDQGGLYLIG